MVQKVVQKKIRDQNSPFLLDLPDAREFDPGTEDLMPYIHKGTWVKKVVLTIVLYPLLAALLSLVISLCA